MTDKLPSDEKNLLVELDPLTDALETVDGRDRLDTILTALINRGRIDDAGSAINWLLEKDLPPLGRAVVLRAEGGRQMTLMNFAGAREPLEEAEQLAADNDDWASAISTNLYQMTICARLDDFVEALRIFQRYQGYNERYLEEHPDGGELAPVSEMIEDYMRRLKE